MDRYIIIAFLAGEATDEERSALEEWRAAHPSNEEEFQRQARMWDQLAALTPADAALLSAAPSSSPPGEDASVIPLRGASRPGFRAARPRRLPQWSGLVAASLLLGLVLGVYGRDRAENRLWPNDIVTGAGEIVTLSLRDGTVVRLGPASRLAFREVAGPRDVFLEGQAYFAVPRGQRHPFRVHAEGGEVKVLGTRFDVRARGSTVDVVVVEGEVEMGSDEQRVSIRRGEMGRLDEASEPVVEPLANVYEATAWIGAFIAYEETPLKEVAQELEARFGLRFEIADPELASRTVTGWFTDQSAVEIASDICVAVSASCRLVGGVFHIEAIASGGVRPPAGRSAV